MEGMAFVFRRCSVKYAGWSTFNTEQTALLLLSTTQPVDVSMCHGCDEKVTNLNITAYTHRPSFSQLGFPRRV